MSARQHLAALALVVPDYDAAIDYYCGVLGFRLVEDTPMGGGKRWVRVMPPGATETALLLAKAVTDQQAAVVGRQAGGRVFLFLHTDDFARDYAAYRARGVAFVEEPRDEPYGKVVVFTDPWGNRWDLVEPARA